MILLYDDTYDGLLCAIFAAFGFKCGCSPVAKSRQTGPSLFECVEIETEPEKADRVTKGMEKLDAALPSTVYYAWLSQLPDIDDAILSTLRLGFAVKSSPLPRRQEQCVYDVLDAARKVGGQAHKFKGFVRFRRAGDDLYIADINPDYNILPLIAQHFHERFNDSRLIIRDIKRRIAVVSDPESWYIAPLPPGEPPPLPNDDGYITLWRGYFKAIANPARKNLRLQQHFVPKKFRKELDEFNSD